MWPRKLLRLRLRGSPVSRQLCGIQRLFRNLRQWHLHLFRRCELSVRLRCRSVSRRVFGAKSRLSRRVRQRHLPLRRQEQLCLRVQRRELQDRVLTLRELRARMSKGRCWEHLRVHRMFGTDGVPRWTVRHVQRAVPDWRRRKVIQLLSRCCTLPPDIGDVRPEHRVRRVGGWHQTRRRSQPRSLRLPQEDHDGIRLMQ